MLNLKSFSAERLNFARWRNCVSGFEYCFATITMMKQSGRSYRANFNAIYDECCMGFMKNVVFNLGIAGDS
jgi:hypothetical protein